MRAVPGAASKALLRMICLLLRSPAGITDRLWLRSKVGVGRSAAPLLLRVPLPLRVSLPLPSASRFLPRGPSPPPSKAVLASKVAHCLSGKWHNPPILWLNVSKMYHLSALPRAAPQAGGCGFSAALSVQRALPPQPPLPGGVDWFARPEILPTSLAFDSRTIPFAEH